MIPISELLKFKQIANQADSVKDVLDKVLKSVRNYFIFDNFVLYRMNSDEKSVDVHYAKSMGRGKTAEADVSWGDILATGILEKRSLILQQPSSLTQSDRLKDPYLLGIPIFIKEDLIGVCVFIRYGGPGFTDEEIEFCKYFADELGLWILKDEYRNLLAELNARSRATQLQEEFIHSITHELRSPLGFIKGYATTLLRLDADWNPETQKEFLEIIDHETDSLEELIDNLLDSARLQAGQFEMTFQPISIKAVLNDVIQRNRVNRPDLEIRPKFSKNIPTVEGDPRRLAQVFENLINNAIKYAPQTAIEILVEPVKKGIQISFRDYGPGIPEKYLPNIFDRFFRNPDQSVSLHGTGLGLFICRQIIESHHGEIHAVSKVGEGTTFHIFLPCIIQKDRESR
jgi:signal transduction histidine kinase